MPKKLGIKEGHKLLIVNAPEDFDRTLGTLPMGVSVSEKPGRGRTENVIILFVLSFSELEKQFSKLADLLKPNGGFWIGWPKKASKIETDLTFDVVQKKGLAAGLVDNKICAIDETWSGLRFVFRVEERSRLK